jgi:hypothetical protein
LATDHRRNTPRTETGIAPAARHEPPPAAAHLPHPRVGRGQVRQPREPRRHAAQRTNGAGDSCPERVGPNRPGGPDVSDELPDAVDAVSGVVGDDGDDHGGDAEEDAAAAAGPGQLPEDDRLQNDAAVSQRRGGLLGVAAVSRNGRRLKRKNKK